jgi:hypothetical protein
MSASTVAPTAPPFLLSPLNEYDEEFDNPLNKAMIVETTATGFLWSKTRDENHRAISNDDPQTAHEGTGTAAKR